MAGPVDVFESRDAGAWPRRWQDLPPRWRGPLVAGLIVALLAAAWFLLGDRLVQRRSAGPVVVTVRLAVAVSSGSPPGGAVDYALLVRNAGRTPVVLTTVRAASERLALRPWTAGERRVEPGLEVQIPMSVQLSCGGVVGRPPDGMRAEVGLRASDGRSVVRREPVLEASSLLDVAATVCSVRPELRGQELSGPVAPGQR